MDVNFKNTIMHTNNSQRCSECDTKQNCKNYKSRGGAKHYLKVGEKNNSKVKRPSFIHKRHNFVNINKCEFEETKLLIVNLHDRVTESDIEMLFVNFGSYKFCKIHYDSQGWCLDSAEVIFGRKEDAIEAMELYNGLKLDGQELKMKLIISEHPVASSPSGSEVNSVNDLEESNSFSDQQVLERELDALFDEFVRSRCSQSRSIS